MTAVTQQMMWNVMEYLTEDKKQLVMNFAIKLSEPQVPLKPDGTIRDDITKSGIDFGDAYTDANHDERMARAFALAKDIEIDEQAIKDLREVSMI